VFSAAASLSGALDIARRIYRVEDDTWRMEFKNIFGDLKKISGTENDLFYLARKLAKSKSLKPKLFQCCGTEDFLYEDNANFRDHANKLGLDLNYEEGPGDHTWAYWDEMIQHVLTWLSTQVMSRSKVR
jgi:S-formylglutathione hydrolase FrmB